MRQIFAADHPCVLSGQYDIYGWKPGEQARAEKAKARQQQQEDTDMAKKRKGPSKTDRKLSTPDTPKRGRPRQQDLPGTEDRAIKPLEDVAAAYADLRDRRIELNREEAELKVHVKKLMHKYDKTIYRREGIEIRLIDGEEDVKVKIRKAGDEDSEQQDHDAADAEDAKTDDDDDQGAEGDDAR
jgi:hypothetical protein